MNLLNYSVSARPTAYITYRKGRKKIHPNNTVYLNDGDEFEIELENFTQNVVLAKILLNGKETSSRGLVLKPGERFHLERYLDSPEKFKFTTYQVDGDNENVQKAIELNGKVEIRFYDEYSQPIFNGYYYSNSGTGNYFSTAGNNIALYTSTADNSINVTCSSMYTHTSNMDTGRVERGDKSDQSFMDSNKRFSTYHFSSIEYKILPMSLKPVTSNELVKFCTSCGKKHKQNDNYCSKCGNKL